MEKFNENVNIVVPKCGKANFKYLVVAPAFRNGMYLLGEMGKFVPVSEQRFVSIDETEDEVNIRVTGVPSETVSVTVYDSEMPSVETVTCYIQDNHYANLVLSRDGSTPPCT